VTTSARRARRAGASFSSAPFIGWFSGLSCLIAAH
jgi:hypothetical protein